MNTLPAGYTSRGDGMYEKRVEFAVHDAGDGFGTERETLVRSATGKLLRVERSGRVQTKRRT